MLRKDETVPFADLKSPARVLSGKARSVGSFVPEKAYRFCPDLVFSELAFPDTNLIETSFSADEEADFSS
jgi:hypothetical protein